MKNGPRNSRSGQTNKLFNTHALLGIKYICFVKLSKCMVWPGLPQEATLKPFFLFQHTRKPFPGSSFFNSLINNFNEQLACNDQRPDDISNSYRHSADLSI
jgi:hypothetical protein